MALALVLTPLALAAVAMLVPSQRWRPWLLPVGGITHSALTLMVLGAAGGASFRGWLELDPLGRLGLGLISVLFLIASLYAPGYLRLRRERDNRVFCAAGLAAQAMMSLVVLSQHLGLIWVAMEATTLAAAPLIYFNRNGRSIEATWKYLLIGSVGIALALLGTFFLAYGAVVAGIDPSLFFPDLVRQAAHLSRPWLHVAFVLLFVGYGTKMGLAPMHTWKPDAYGEAPGLVGVLLAGEVTTCAFLAMLRFFQICSAAGEAVFARQIMVAFGLFSMAMAGVFMAGQRDYKRMLAYSSVEHMGILVLGVGLGGAGVFGALLHLVNNAITKGVLFLSAGNIHRAFDSKRTEEVAGAIRRVPVSGALFLAGFFAITGSPPFGPFVSELTILRAAISAERYGVGALFLVALVVIFVGMGVTVLKVVQGEPPPGEWDGSRRDRFATVAPPLAFLALSLLLGIYIPQPLSRVLHDAAAFISVTP
jgi:hydrogenase-4 component F